MTCLCYLLVPPSKLEDGLFTHTISISLTCHKLSYRCGSNFFTIIMITVSPHWVNTNNEFSSAPDPNSKGVTDLPMFSVKTFSAEAGAEYSRPGSSADEQGRHSSSQSPSSFLDPNGAATSQTDGAQAPAAATTTTTTTKGNAKGTIVPKRVAPPPPKNNKKGKKSRERTASVQYDVPVARGRWYSRRKKTTKTEAYEGLNLQQLQPPSAYCTPGQ